MTIRVFPDRIEFNNYTLTATPTGASFTGGIAASRYGSTFTVGQGKSYAFKHGATGPSQVASGYKFAFASDDLVTRFSSSLVPGFNAYRGTSHSSETHGYTTFGHHTTDVEVNRINSLPGHTAGFINSNPLLLTPISRFSFSSQSGSEDIGMWTSIYWDGTKQSNAITVPKNIGFTSKQDGYVVGKLSVFNDTIGGCYRFSLTSAVNKAVIGIAPYGNYIDTSRGLISTSLNTTFCGTSLSNETHGYCVDSPSLSPSPAGVIAGAFYKKFPFATESTLSLINASSASPVDNNRLYMTGITGPDKGYWFSGWEAAQDGVIGFPGEPSLVMNKPSASANRAQKFPFATDVLSTIPFTPTYSLDLGFGHSGTASETTAYLLNGFTSPTVGGISSPVSFSFTSITGSYGGPYPFATYSSTKRLKFLFSSESLSGINDSNFSSHSINGVAHQY